MLLGTCSGGAMKSQDSKSESRVGTGDPAVAEEAAYQTGLDTSRLMCPPIVRHAALRLEREYNQTELK